MPNHLALRELLVQLTHRNPPFADSDAPECAESLLPNPGIGYSQFNEVLLLLGYDRVSPAFFQYLLDGTSDYVSGAAFKELGRLQEGVDRFRKHAMWFYGNIRFALQRMSDEGSNELPVLLTSVKPKDEGEFEGRHDPVVAVKAIDPRDTYYLGYVIEGEIESQLTKNPNDPQALEAKAKMQRVREIGHANYEAYLTWDHMDVYVATSMREHHQYYSISKTTNAIFGDKRLESLKLRWFDPTQAYCRSRLDKGLAEALMLKRAACTLYLIQEADSFGKDSELASTLAQGKVVIAYVPALESQDEFISELREMCGALYPDQDWVSVLRDQLELFDPHSPWTDPEFRDWLGSTRDLQAADLETRLFQTAKAVYDKRANLLMEVHPLGLQVDIDTGVAHGVLVARSIEQCVELLHATIMQRLDFHVKEMENTGTLLLKEKISGSVARVVTGDRLLTNAFWNFYPA